MANRLRNEFGSLRETYSNKVLEVMSDISKLHGRLSDIFNQMIAYQNHAAKSLTAIHKKLSNAWWPRSKSSIDKEVRGSMQYIPNFPGFNKEPPSSFRLKNSQLVKLLIVLNQIAHPDGTEEAPEKLRNLEEPGYWRKQLKLYSKGEVSKKDINYTAARLSQYYRAIVATNSTVAKIAEILEVVDKKLDKMKSYIRDNKKPFIFGEDPIGNVKEHLRLFTERVQEMQKSMDEGKKEGLKTTADSNVRIDAAMRAAYP